MRPIKFRAYDKNHKQWLEPGDISIGLNGGLLAPMSNKNLWMICNERDIELSQSTGLKDKNGKEIFEGDVISYEGVEGPGMKQEVKYEAYEDCCVQGIGYGFGEHGAPTSGEEVEIIGNVYEHPDLLK